MNKFGCSRPANRSLTPIIRPPTLSLDEKGDYNANHKKIRNVNNPEKSSDASTKSYVDSMMEELKKTILELKQQSIGVQLNLNRTLSEMDHQIKIQNKISSAESLRLDTLENKFNVIRGRIDTVEILYDDLEKRLSE